MRQDVASEGADAVGAPERQRRMRSPGGTWVPFTIVGGIVVGPFLVPLLLFAAIAAGWILTAPFAAADELLNSNELTPGRWEAVDGEFWVDLRTDQTCSLRLPSQPDGTPWGTPLRESMVVVEATCTWTFTPAGSGTYGSLDVTATPTTTAGADMSVWWPWLRGGGSWWGGGYDWNTLAYAVVDPEVPDLRLVKVADY